MSDYQERIAKALQVEMVESFCWELSDDAIEQLARPLAAKIERALEAAAMDASDWVFPDSYDSMLHQAKKAGIEELEKPNV